MSKILSVVLPISNPRLIGQLQKSLVQVISKLQTELKEHTEGRRP